MTEQPDVSDIILIVEDDHQIRKLAGQVLKRAGYQVLEAADGLDAMTLYQQTQPTIGLLITDMAMPKMSGVELAQQLQSQEPTLKVLYISGYMGASVNEAGGLNNQVQLLEKPFTMTSLIEKVQEILKR